MAMKTLAIGSFFVLFAIVAGVATVPSAFADHPTAEVSAPPGSAVPGCEETNECYIPADVSVDVGGEVTWTNDDTAAHTVTSGTPEGGPDGVFDSSLFMAGTTFSHTFEEEGVYPYFCMVHPWMVGTVTVVADGAMEEEHEDDHGDDMDMHESDVQNLPTGAPSGTGMLSDGTTVNVWSSAPENGAPLTITIEFEDSEHVNHDILVTQNGETVLDDQGAHHHEGMGVHTSAPLSSGDPVDITVTFQGFGIDELTGPIGEEVVFTNVVPEFGTVAMMILAVAIISIIAMSAKSRVIPRL